MKRELKIGGSQIVTIENGIVSVPATNGNVWMTEYEIADLFQVFISAVIANRKAILKSGVLWKEDVCREIKTQNGSIEQYNLEMIMALAFRIKSYRTEIFRNWMIRKLTTIPVPQELLINFQSDIDKIILN